jgi:putative transposase
MPNYHRVRIEGGVYFFTVVTFQRHPILTTTAARKILHDAWKQTTQKWPFETIAVCLLPEHIHCIWKLPEGDSDYSSRWNMIKGIFSRNYRLEIDSGDVINTSRQKRREVAIWQRRFWEHTIFDNNDLENHFHYIHYNPIKHGYVTKAFEWPWSSFHHYVRVGYYDLYWSGGDKGKLREISLECEYEKI